MQIMSTCFYCVTGVVIYYYAGPEVLSPALGSATPIVRKVAFGLAAPTIIIGGCVNNHVVCKMAYLRIWRRQIESEEVENVPEAQPAQDGKLSAPSSNEVAAPADNNQVERRLRAEESVLHKRDFKAIGSWVALDFLVWGIAWVIAESIPNFSLLLSLVVRVPLLLDSFQLTSTERGVWWLV